MRNLVGCSPWGREESDMTKWLHFHFSLSCIGEGNGNPLQCSCLENPRDGEAWWAAIYGVAQGRIWLKRLSSSSSNVDMGPGVFHRLFTDVSRDPPFLIAVYSPLHAYATPSSPHIILFDLSKVTSRLWSFGLKHGFSLFQIRPDLKCLQSGWMPRWWDFRDSCPQVSPSSHVRSYPLPTPPDTGGALSGTQLSLYIVGHIKHHRVKQLQKLGLNQGLVTLKSRILTIIPFLYYLYRLKRPRLLSPYPSPHPPSPSAALYILCLIFAVVFACWAFPFCFPGKLPFIL